MASTAASFAPTSQATPPPPAPAPGGPQEVVSNASAGGHQSQEAAAAAAFQQRMDQFLRQQQQLEAANSSNSEKRDFSFEASTVTSGSNSGEEDERELGENSNNKRLLLGSQFNGLSSKKRRKQSKPIRLGADTDNREEGELVIEEGEKPASDGPLNLSSGGRSEEEGERPSLRVLGPELLQQHHQNLPEMAAKLQQDLNNIPTSLYQGMLPFGLPPFPFPFPGGSSPNTKQLPPTSMANATGRPQIFNPEAYCELCNKEFCNKYFLKTHKANKHGIYSDPPPTNNNNNNNGQQQQSPQPPPPTSTPSSHGGPNTEPGEAGPPTPNSQAGGSPFSGAFIAANMGSLRPPFLPLSPGASPSPNSKGNNNAANAGENLSNGGAENNKELPSPSQHRDAVDGESLRLASKENDELRKSLESPSSISAVNSKGGLPPPPNLPPHLSNFNPMMFGGLPSLESLRKESEEAGSAAARSLLEAGKLIPNIPNIPNVPNLSAAGGQSNGGSAKGPFTADKLRQMGVINADAFCEICCKEFCNKYFLRVHKLKKHGICSPDLPPEKVQKILNQMAKEAGKTGNPPPPIIRPPMLPNAAGTSAEQNNKRPSSSSSASGLPPPPILPPQLRPPFSAGNGSGLMQLPPLEPLLPQALKDLPPLPTTPNAPLPPQLSSSSGANNSQEIIRISDDSNDNNKDGVDKDGEEGETRGESPGSKGPAGEKEQPASEDLQRLQSMIMELNSNKAKMNSSNGIAGNETLCKICNKDMENKYFLRAHMMNEHGVLHMEEPPQLPVDPSKSGSSGSKEEGEKSMSKIMSLINGNSPHAGANEPPVIADFASKFLQQFKGMGGSLPPHPPSGMEGDELSFLERVKSELSGQSPKKHLDKDPNRKPASLSRSYCEICKKELCNKYFMKTHMMKMHGINIEATNQTGVSCHLCKKELCSKYFLKVHLQNSHGIIDDSIKENGSPATGGLFSGLFPPPPEMLGLPPTSQAAAVAAASGSDKEHYFSRLLGEQSEISRERLKELERQKHMLGKEAGANGHTCSLCGEEFPEIVALQVHIIKSHGAFPHETSGLMNPESGNGSRPDSGAVTPVNSKDLTGEKKDEEGSGKEISTPPLNIPASTSSSTSTSALPPPSTMNNTTTSAQSSSSSQANNSASSPPTSSSPAFPAAGSGDPAAAHLEMLQRHLSLSAQFPGLINPLLTAGFPGSPGSAPTGFPNHLQQFLAAGGLAAAGIAGPNLTSTPKDKEPQPTEGGSEAKKSDDEGQKLTAKKKSTATGRRFKCSKCGLKFRKRQNCLKHIQAEHATAKISLVEKRLQKQRRKLQFGNSPLKKNYVRELMDLLKVPTSRATLGGDNVTKQHIMQPFLLKTPKSRNGDDEQQPQEPEFVPSLVYLPVAKRVSQPLTVAFSLTPA